MYLESVFSFKNHKLTEEYKAISRSIIEKASLKSRLELDFGIEKEIAQFLKNFCKLNTIEIASIYKKELAAELFKRKFPFLHVKKYGQKIYSTFELKSTEETSFQDGNGDVIFT